MSFVSCSEESSENDDSASVIAVWKDADDSVYTFYSNNTVVYDGGSCAYTGEQTASSGTVVIGNNYATITITGSNTATGTYTNGATGETSSISLTRIQ